MQLDRIREALELLGLPSMVTRQQIRERYHQLAKRYHPDREGGDARKMEELIRAYETLRDYIDHFRFRFDEEEITRQFPEESHSQKFKF